MTDGEIAEIIGCLQSIEEKLSHLVDHLIKREPEADSKQDIKTPSIINSGSGKIPL